MGPRNRSPSMGKPYGVATTNRLHNQHLHRLLPEKAGSPREADSEGQFCKPKHNALITRGQSVFHVVGAGFEGRRQVTVAAREVFESFGE